MNGAVISSILISAATLFGSSDNVYINVQHAPEAVVAVKGMPDACQKRICISLSSRPFQR